MSNPTSQDCTLQVAQQGIKRLLQWANANLPTGCSCTPDSPAVQQAKRLLCWPNETQSETGIETGIGPLRLLFDLVCLDADQPQEAIHFVLMAAISDTDPQIPYPVNAEPNTSDYQKIIRQDILKVLADNASWNNLSLLMMILEKYGSCLSFGESDVALIDQVRITGAIAAALANNPEAEHLSLIAGDLSGIQNFIYTISSDGALKSLRARSFYLELLTEEIVQQLLKQLNLPRTNVIYAGGGNLYLLATASDETKRVVKSVQQNLNQWLLQEFQGKIFLALDQLEFPTRTVTTPEFAGHWEAGIKQLAVQKNQKFRYQINQALQKRISYDVCRVCHRDDVRKLAFLSRDSTVQACSTCGRMFRLGGQLLRTEAIVRSHHVNPSDIRIRFKLPSQTVYYRLFDTIDAAFQVAEPNQDAIFLVNNWTLEHYQSNYVAPLLLGNYGQVSKDGFEDDQQGQRKPGIMRAEEFARNSEGIQRVGYLRMDVDRLGQIFARGLGKHHSLTRLAGLSRQMNYFFKVYLNSLAKHRTANLPDSTEQQDLPNLLFIYAGGDDLFISGSWNQVVDFACDVYRAFRLYAGEHPEITLSGGISIAGEKFPLYQAAAESGKAEDAAKGNGRDSLGLFGQVFKWSEWLGTADLRVLAEGDRQYLNPETQPPLFGVYPFVAHLNQLLDKNLARSFVRNLLLTAQIQEQAVKQYQEKHQLNGSNKDSEPASVKDLRYYLHLPKVAYTLARLPRDVRGDPEFRASLLSPYNAPYFRAIATWIELLNRNT